MAVVGTLTSSRKMRWVLYMILSAGFSAYCYYDGWINPKYQVQEELSNRMFNQVGAVVLAVVFIVLVIRYLVQVSKTRVVVDDTGIEVNGKVKIGYQAIVRVDDKNLEKGLLDIFYREGAAERKYVLDNYVVTNFEEMVEEIAKHRPDLIAIEPVEDKPTDQSGTKAGGE